MKNERERERKGEGGREGGGKREREKEGGGKREREREREGGREGKREREKRKREGQRGRERQGKRELFLFCCNATLFLLYFLLQEFGKTWEELQHENDAEDLTSSNTDE